jgi:DNA topoisomerase-2
MEKEYEKQLMTKTIEEKYQKKDLREHILTRPDTYIGSVKSTTDEIFVLEKENPEGGLKMKKQVLTYVPGLYKIFDEILVNAMDHSVNDLTVTQIKVVVNENEISVFNDGAGVIVEKHKVHGVYVPELIFGNLLTSSNYDDNEQRVTGGRNGLGSKIVSIYSKKFIVETVDTVNMKKYIQTFSENMTEKTDPKISTIKTAKSYTKITFEPDLKRFGMTSLDSDIIALIEKRVYDCSACTRKEVSVYYNGVMIKQKTFEKYVDLFIGNKKDTQRVYQSNENGWEIACCMNDEDKFKQVSFVNGIWTIYGGKHVDYIQNQITKKLAELIQGKNKNLVVKPNYIKERLFLFVKSTIVNPTFSSQTKDTLTSNVKDFGFRFDVSDEFIMKLSKCGIVEEIVAFAKHKETRELKTTDGKKRSKVKVAKLDDANWAGTGKSEQCTLILTEGLSAKTFAISGMTVVGRDKYGVFPLRGKVLNIRDAAPKKIAENQEIIDLKAILGLEQGKEYKSLSDLRYGKVMILADADVDGHHIAGLIMNVFHSAWPSLMKFENFIIAMKTPVLKVIKRNQIKEFFTLTEFNQWKESNDISGWTTKYYKGLGTSSAKEAKEYFSDMNKTIVKYQWDKDTDKNMKMAFEKKQADKRKEWLGEYNPNKVNEVIAKENRVVKYSEFINNDLIEFSISDLKRSIPSVCDGMKPSQRKILFYMLKKDLTKEIKVSQLGGYISAETSYHHGPASMEGTIINMAQDYMGSNNLNLLEPVGQFGTRLAGGKDAASSRYINTCLRQLTKVIFNDSDNYVLNYLEDDGMSIEPEWYIPIIPMVLVNGVDGIGTGYSSFLPCYNPKDIIKNLTSLINDEPMTPMDPYYKGFKGEIIKVNEIGYQTKGVFKKISNTKIEIQELPVGRWTDDYKEFLESDTLEKTVKD